MVGYMGSTDNFGSQSSGRGRKRPHRHSYFQTQKLEAYFETCQHPNERQRCQLGREVGLTPTQIKFWFQNKRTLTKAQTGRLEGSALREENERIQFENLTILKALNEELCMECKGLSTGKEDKQIVERLKIENAQLNAEYERLTNLLAKSGVSISEINSPVALNGTIPRGPSLDDEIYSKNLYDQTWEQKPKPMQEFNIPRLVQVVFSGSQELTALMAIESLWIKDPINGRYIIHRDNYEKTFLKNSHLNSSQTRFESSKEEGVVRMNGLQLVGMLYDSAKRLDLFPTIITKSMAMQRFEAGFGGLNGAVQLVHEQIHMLSPLVEPREFDLIRYFEQVDDGAWIVLDISHNFLNEDKLQTSSFRSWKFPSGCLIKDLSNGSSKITWVEHVEVDDKGSSTHRLYKDVILSGLGYGAERYIFNLQRICDRFACQMSETATSQEVEAIRIPEGRKSIMNLTKRMAKDLCAKLSTKNKLDVPQLSQLNNNETRVNIYENNGPGLPNGVIICVTTSFWIPISYQEAFKFFTNARNRYQWDVLSNGTQMQEIASITYGKDLGNRVSIIQSINPCDGNTVLVQESCMDLQGGMIVYSPIHTKSVDMVLNGKDSSGVPIVTSGFIISSDGNNNNVSRDGASTSTATQNGSLLTVALQTMPSNSSSLGQVNALISSIIQKIKTSLNGSN